MFPFYIRHLAGDPDLAGYLVIISGFQLDIEFSVRPLSDIRLSIETGYPTIFISGQPQAKRDMQFP